MRLINTRTLALEIFAGEPPDYAILSHTWESGEVTLQDYTLSHASSLDGYAKILKTCEIARENGIPYAWIDTCCIDKTSSAELSEAINSMYNWYARAKIAYIFLSDWEVVAEGDDLDVIMPGLSVCRWFTRGWTLQELIAPKNAELYDCEWNLRGNKLQNARVLSLITGIDEQVLKNIAQLSDYSIAERMSWAAGRQTTRVEDKAYSLLGIFDVNMPMLYGEGEKAFIRLQEAIMSESTDLTLFAWQARGFRNIPDRDNIYRGILAHSPDEFAGIGRIESSGLPGFDEEFTLTNKGVKITTGLAANETILSLNCTIEFCGTKCQIGIYLKKYGSGMYARTKPWELAMLRDDEWELGRPAQIYIKKNLPGDKATSQSIQLSRTGSIRIVRGLDLDTFKPYICEPKSRWDESELQFLSFGTSSFRGIIGFRATASLKDQSVPKVFWLVCGVDNRHSTGGVSKPWVSLASMETDPQLGRGLMDEHHLRNAVESRDRKTLKLRGLKQTVQISLSVQFDKMYSNQVAFVRLYETVSTPKKRND